MKTKKIKATWTQEMADDLKNYHGIFGKNTNIDMLHYEYTANDDKELELIKELAEIDYENGKHLIYSMSKKQLRKIKLGAIDSIRECARMKKIIFNSEIIRDVSKILEYHLSKEIATEIDKEIIKKMSNYLKK